MNLSLLKPALKTAILLAGLSLVLKGAIGAYNEIEFYVAAAQTPMLSPECYRHMQKVKTGGKHDHERYKPSLKIAYLYNTIGHGQKIGREFAPSSLPVESYDGLCENLPATVFYDTENPSKATLGPGRMANPLLYGIFGLILLIGVLYRQNRVKIRVWHK